MEGHRRRQARARELQRQQWARTTCGGWTPPTHFGWHLRSREVWLLLPHTLGASLFRCFCHRRAGRHTSGRTCNQENYSSACKFPVRFIKIAEICCRFGKNEAVPLMALAGGARACRRSWRPCKLAPEVNCAAKALGRFASLMCSLSLVPVGRLRLAGEARVAQPESSSKISRLHGSPLNHRIAGRTLLETRCEDGHELSLIVNARCKSRWGCLVREHDAHFILDDVHPPRCDGLAMLASKGRRTGPTPPLSITAAVHLSTLSKASPEDRPFHGVQEFRFRQARQIRTHR